MCIIKKKRDKGKLDPTIPLIVFAEYITTVL